MELLIFGDSITYGWGDVEGGWVARLRKQTDAAQIESAAQSRTEIYNLGVSGDTSEDLRQRFEPEIESRVSFGSTPHVVIAIGINDSLLRHAEETHQVVPDRFRDNIVSLLRAAAQYTTEIAIVGLTPVDEERTDPIPGRRDKSYRNAYIQHYDTILREVAEEHYALYIPLFTDFIDKPHYETEYLHDGIHPNAAGHERIKTRVAAALSEHGMLP